MRTVHEIAQIVEEWIGYIYERPLMYGGTPEGVHLILYYAHWFWAVVFCREDDYQMTFHEIREEERCNGHNFASRYQRDKPGASDEETVRYVVAQWKKITGRLEISIPPRMKQEESGGLLEPPDYKAPDYQPPQHPH